MAMSVVYTTVNGQILRENRGGVVSDFVPDPLGSVVMVQDAAGAAVYRAEYDPYGNVQSETGTNPSSLGYVGTLGYIKDSATSMYVRARYLLSNLGRWLTKDPLWPSEPGFVYAGASPSFFVDVSGRQCSFPFHEHFPPCQMRPHPRPVVPPGDIDFETGPGGGRIGPPGISGNPGRGKPGRGINGTSGSCRVLKCFSGLFGGVSHEFLCVQGPNGGCSGGFYRGSGTDVFGAPGGVADRDVNCDKWMRGQGAGSRGCVEVSTDCRTAQRVCKCIQDQVIAVREGTSPDYNLVGYNCLDWVGTVMRCAGMGPPPQPPNWGGPRPIREH